MEEKFFDNPLGWYRFYKMEENEEGISILKLNILQVLWIKILCAIDERFSFKKLNIACCCGKILELKIKK